MPRQNPPALADTSPPTPLPVRFLPVDQVLDIIGLKKSWMYKAIKEGNFPAPVSIPGTRRALFSSRDIDRWITEKTTPTASLAASERGVGK